jgi:hypothetical protein
MGRCSRSRCKISVCRRPATEAGGGRTHPHLRLTLLRRETSFSAGGEEGMGEEGMGEEGRGEEGMGEEGRGEERRGWYLGCRLGCLALIPARLLLLLLLLLLLPRASSFWRHRMGLSNGAIEWGYRTGLSNGEWRMGLCALIDRGQRSVLRPSSMR